MNIEDLIGQAWSQASKNEFFQGGALLAVLAAIGMYLKSVPIALWDRIKRRIQYVAYMDNTTHMYDAFSDWFLEKYPESFKRIEAQLTRNRYEKDTKFELIIRQFNDFNIIRRGAWYISVKKDKERLEAAQSQSSRYVETYTVSSLFGRSVIQSMLEEVKDHYNEKQIGWKGLRVVVTDDWDENKDIYLPVYKKLNQLFIDGKDELIHDINNFLAKRDFYYDHAIRFKRGYLLYGPGGTGKTALVFAIADYLNMPVYYLNPKGFSNDKSFENFISEVRDKSIILIEDVDIFWTNRSSQGNTQVSFQSLLNVLDGLHSPHDVLIFMTTNHPEEFDKAFLRKGRLDYKMLVDHPGKKQVEDFLGNFYGVDNVILKEYSLRIPMVDIQDICIKNSTLEEAISVISKIK